MELRKVFVPDFAGERPASNTDVSALCDRYRFVEMDVCSFYIPDYPAWVVLRHGGTSPLAVVSQGTVIAAGPEAGSSGVEAPMEVGRAQSLCDTLHVQPRDRDLEVAEWERIEQLLNETTPHLERERPGHSYLRPHDVERLQSVVRELGACAAFAPTRLDADLAALKAVEGEILEISREYLTAFRRDVPVDRLSAVGVEEDIVDRLSLFGYKTVAAVRALSKKHLSAQFGEAGAILHDRLSPNEEQPVSVFTPPPSIEKAFRFENPRNEPGPIEEIIASLIEKAVSDLRGRTAQRLTLRLFSRSEGAIVHARTLREPHSTEHPLRTTAETLLQECLVEEAAVEEVTVILGALAPPEAQQGTLFYQRPGVQKAIRAVQKKHPGVLKKPVLKRNAVFEEDRVHYQVLRT